MRLHPMARAGRSHPEFLVVVDMRVDLLCGGPKCDLSSVVERINALSEKVRSEDGKDRRAHEARQPLAGVENRRLDALGLRRKTHLSGCRGGAAVPFAVDGLPRSPTCGWDVYSASPRADPGGAAKPPEPPVLASTREQSCDEGKICLPVSSSTMSIDVSSERQRYFATPVWRPALTRLLCPERG